MQRQRSTRELLQMAELLKVLQSVDYTPNETLITPIKKKTVHQFMQPPLHQLHKLV